MRSGDNNSVADLSELPKWQSGLISQILNSVNDFYCLPEKFAANRNNLQNNLVNKCREFNRVNSIDVSAVPPDSQEIYLSFVSKINEALHDFDSHLELAYNPDFISQMTTADKIEQSGNSAKFNFSGGPPKEEVEKWNKYEEENPTFRNFGFVDYQGPAGVIPDNIGYVNISHLIDPQSGVDEMEDKYRLGPNAIKRLRYVMEQMRNKEAIILDLSVTPYGGYPEMVQNIVSYFMPEQTLINTIHDRMSGHETQYNAINTPFKLLKPVALLVGSNTFSGREEIAYDLQQFNTTLDQSRFTVIGQPTKGGAHPECSFPLVEVPSGQINNKFILRVPYARSINPVSGTNWEDQVKKGVQPDILASSEDTLKVAIQHLNESLGHIQQSGNTYQHVAKKLNVSVDTLRPTEEAQQIAVTSKEKSHTRSASEPLVTQSNKTVSDRPDSALHRKLK